MDTTHQQQRNGADDDMDIPDAALNGSALNGGGGGDEQKVSNRPVSLLPRDSLVDGDTLALMVSGGAGAENSQARRKFDAMRRLIGEMADTNVRPKDIAEARPKTKAGMCIRGTLISVTPSRNQNVDAMSVVVMVDANIRQAIYNLDERPGLLVFDSYKYNGAMFVAYTRQKMTPEYRAMLIQQRRLDASSRREWDAWPTAVAVLQPNAFVRATIHGKRALRVGDSEVPRGTPVTLTRVSMKRSVGVDGGIGAEYTLFAEGIEVGPQPLDAESVFTEALRRANIVPPLTRLTSETLDSVPDGLSFTAPIDGDDPFEEHAGAPPTQQQQQNKPVPLPQNGGGAAASSHNNNNAAVEEIDADGNVIVTQAPMSSSSNAAQQRGNVSTALVTTGGGGGGNQLASPGGAGASHYTRRGQIPKHDIPLLYVGERLFVVHANMPAHEQLVLNMNAPRPYVTLFGRVTLNIDNMADFWKKNEEKKEEHVFGRIDIAVKQAYPGGGGGGQASASSGGGAGTPADSSVLLLQVSKKALPEMTGLVGLEVQKQLARFALAHYRGDVLVHMRAAGAESTVEGLGQSLYYELWVDTVSLLAVGATVATAGFELRAEQVRALVASAHLNASDVARKATNEARLANPLNRLDSDMRFGDVVNITQSRYAFFDQLSLEEMRKRRGQTAALREFIAQQSTGPLVEMIRADTHRFFVLAALYKTDDVLAVEQEMRSRGELDALTRLHLALIVQRKLADDAPQPYKDMLRDADAAQESKNYQLFAISKQLLEQMGVACASPAAAAAAAARNTAAPSNKAARTPLHDDAAETANSNTNGGAGEAEESQLDESAAAAAEPGTPQRQTRVQVIVEEEEDDDDAAAIAVADALEAQQAAAAAAAAAAASSPMRPSASSAKATPTRNTSNGGGGGGGAVARLLKKQPGAAQQQQQTPRDSHKSSSGSSSSRDRHHSHGSSGSAQKKDRKRSHAAATTVTVEPESDE